MRWHADAVGLRYAGTAWRSGYVHSDLSLAIDAATDGKGVFLADDILCKNEITQGNLIRLMPETMLCTWHCAGVTNYRTTNTTVRVFLDWLISASRGQREDFK